ncbi:vitelline membrane outer layer protein 1 homolog [Bombina bombina]|uniref:vitelline membrane outer layer protein 1 homolog n=1 Tax=Bombina bombina TaxID=8345 RepID=UPI00235A98D6|nr:vitelline membrane outer layer protein 1 homolog [Bombina bombina]
MPPTMLFFTFPWLLSFFLASGEIVENIISVNNGGIWGVWGPLEKCPGLLKAIGFSIKVQEYQKLGDDTALNGIKLYCGQEGDFLTTIEMISTKGRWGHWTSPMWCPSGYLVSFYLRVVTEGRQRDATGVNNIKFVCSDNEHLEGLGYSWGSYGEMSEKCVQGICGMKTKVQEDQGHSDDSSLNDVRFLCCS